MIKRLSKVGAANAEFAANLRYLCGYYRSASEVCRRIGINRQQFNKYLTGTARPSARNMRRICEFFGVDEFEVLAPHSELRKIVQIHGVRAAREDENFLDRTLKRALAQSDPAIRKYHGYYFAYYYSFSTPGRILKSLLILSERDGLPGYKRIERLINRESPSGPGFVYKYEGIALYLRERIFLIDREHLTGNEISHSVFYPSYKNKVDLLPGLILGTAGMVSREPICSRILLEYLGPTVDARARLRECGLYSPRSGALDPGIVEAIRNEISARDYSLRALPH